MYKILNKRQIKFLLLGFLILAIFSLASNWQSVKQAYLEGYKAGYSK